MSLSIWQPFLAVADKIFGIEADTVKEIIKLLGAIIAASGTYIVGWIQGRTGSLQGGDFHLETDQTTIEICGEVGTKTKLAVKISRSFKMKAKTKGRYRFLRTLEGKTTKGKWDRCEIYYRGERVGIRSCENDSKVQAEKSLKFNQDEVLEVRELRSHEKIDRSRGFYLLVITESKGPTCAKFSVSADAGLNGKARCYAVSEDLEKNEIPLNGSDYQIVAASDAGVTYFVEW